MSFAGAHSCLSSTFYKMKIEYTSIDRVSDFWNAVDQVAKERKYLLFTEAPKIEGTKSYLAEIIEKNWTQFLAIESNQVIGWCDIIPYQYEGCQHVAHMGMGVIPSHRRRGIGRGILKIAIDDAFSKEIERIEMEVFSTNVGAIALYEEFGFSIEGRKTRARRIDGIEHDIISMALHKKQVEPVAAGQRR
jgi:RimJ/RimL family protein N-acetyltransferase